MHQVGRRQHQIPSKAGAAALHIRLCSPELKKSETCVGSRSSAPQCRRLLTPSTPLENRLLGTAEAGAKATSAPEIADESASLIGSIERAFQSRSDVAWSAVTLERKLRHSGFAFQAKNPRASINTALTRLVERGVIAVCKRGNGRRPSLYKSLPAGNAAALRGRFAAMMPESPYVNGNVAGEEENVDVVTEKS